MYKILLADDEGIVIDSLKFIIEKEFSGECITEFAGTGRSVIELAESFRPDIAVVDIQMPGINGLDAMKEIRKTNPNVIFIVISDFDKFDYAKEAIRLGALEYLSKPMEKGRVVNALQRAMDRIDRERTRRSNELLVREKLETVIPIIESGLIYNILFQEHFVEDIENYKSVLEITEKNAYMIVVVCGDEQDGSHMTNAVGSGVRMQEHYQEIRSSLKGCFNCIVGAVMANKLAVLVPYGPGKMEYNERIELIGKARELVRQMRKKTDIRFRIGIGGVRKFYDMGESYSEALGALVITTGSVAHVDDLPIGCEYDGDYPINLERQLFSQIENGETDNAIATCRSFFDWMTENGTDNMMDIRLKMLEFVLWAEHIACEKGGMTYRFNTRTEYLPEIMAMSDPARMRDWFVEKIAAACRNVLSRRVERSRSVIETAKEFIRENYSRELSLDETSKAVNISPYYFSRIFKENTGQSFIEYLTAIRMEKAKELLTSTEFSMKEIGSMVGYSDPNYFSRSFKKNVGVTPTEYKEAASE